MPGGTSTSSQQQTSQNQGYAPAMTGVNGALTGLTGLLGGAGLNSAQSGAIAQLTANGQAGNQFAAPISASATGLLNGGGAQNNDAAITSAYQQYQAAMNPTASGSQIGKNSALQAQLDTLGSDVTSQVNSQFAAAGRGGSGANLQTLGRGILQAQAPVVAAQYNQDVQNQMNAINGIYNGANTTYGMLNGTQGQANQNQIAGAGQASTATQAQNYGPNQVLAAQQQAFNIPAQNYQTLLGSISPVAQAFGQNTGTSNGTQTMSGAQQFGMLANGASSLVNPAKYLFG